MFFNGKNAYANQPLVGIAPLKREISMSKALRTVFADCESEKIIEKSRFLTYCAHVESEEEARAFVAKIRAKHSLATHVCYAFVADKLGNLQRFSDDGEPQGTAGIPILEVIKNKKLFETAVAVVRYFGGIKLGAGGLVRAYSSSASECLDIADIRVLETCVEYCIFVDYTGIDGAQKYISTHTCTLLSTDYGARVAFRVAVKKAQEDAFVSGLVDYMQGRVETQRGEEYYAPFQE